MCTHTEFTHAQLKGSPSTAHSFMCVRNNALGARFTLYGPTYTYI